MAFYISITKVSEDDVAARYRFVGDNERAGTFSIDKGTGDISLIEQMPGDEGGHMFNRAAMKVMRAWKQGSLPETTEWAS